MMKPSFYYTPYSWFKYKRYWFFCLDYDKTYKAITFRFFGLTMGSYPNG
jgi:hypothetical protein